MLSWRPAELRKAGCDSISASLAALSLQRLVRMLPISANGSVSGFWGASTALAGNTSLQRVPAVSRTALLARWSRCRMMQSCQVTPALQGSKTLYTHSCHHTTPSLATSVFLEKHLAHEDVGQIRRSSPSNSEEPMTGLP